MPVESKPIFFCYLKNNVKTNRKIIQLPPKALQCLILDYKIFKFSAMLYNFNIYHALQSIKIRICI